VGFQFVSAVLIAWDVLSSSLRRTEALLVSFMEMAVSREFLKDSSWERRWIMGQRSVERPRSVSTELRGELGSMIFDGGAGERGTAVAWVLLLGAVPSDKAAITS